MSFDDFATPLMRLTERQYAVIVGHCYDGYPDEACGSAHGAARRRASPTGGSPTRCRA